MRSNETRANNKHFMLQEQSCPQDVNVVVTVLECLLITVGASSFLSLPFHSIFLAAAKVSSSCLSIHAWLSCQGCLLQLFCTSIITFALFPFLAAHKHSLPRQNVREKTKKKKGTSNGKNTRRDGSNKNQEERQSSSLRIETFFRFILIILWHKKRPSPSIRFEDTIFWSSTTTSFFLHDVFLSMVFLSMFCRR